MIVYGARGSEILKGTSVSTRTLRDFLQILKNLYLIVEEEGVYLISDSIYRKVILKLI